MHFHLLLRTGPAPIATVMRRLLTGHAVRYNRRHQRNGHLFLIGERTWQNSKKVLRYFGKRASSARPNYKEFVAKGIDEGRRDDLSGSGLIRSAGGWAAVKELQRILFMISVLFLPFSSAVIGAAGDFDWMTDLNISAEADPQRGSEGRDDGF